MKGFRSVIETHFMALLCFAAALNALLPAGLESIRLNGFLQSFTQGIGHSYIIWFSLILAVKSAIDKDAKTPQLSVFIWLSILIVTILLLLPSAMLSWFICLELSLIWWLQREATASQRIAACILFAIALRDPLCQSLLHLFAGQILSFDAWISGSILTLINDPVVISGNILSRGDGHTLLILTGCSAFTNISLALLLWFSLSLYLNRSIHWYEYLRALLLALVILTVNAIRLALMAINETLYTYLHGDHAQMFMEVLTIVITLLFIKRSQSNENGAYGQRSDSGSASCSSQSLCKE